MSRPDLTIYAGKVMRNGQTTYYYTDCLDTLPPDIMTFQRLNYGTLAQVMNAIKQVESQGDNVSWQVGDEFYETER